MVYQIIVFGLIALFFAGGMMFKKKDWSYGGTHYDAKETRASGVQIFLAIFLFLWCFGA